MIEILVLFRLFKNIGLIVASKGRPKFLFQLLLVVFWFGSEIVGGFLGAVIEVIATGNEEPSMLLAWLVGIAGAALSAFILFQIAKALPPLAVYPAPGHESYGDWQNPGDPRTAPIRSDNTAFTETPPRNPAPPDDRFHR